MARVILDSGAVIALAAGDARARALVTRAVRQGDLLVIPAVVLAETTRGGARDAPVNRVVNSVGDIPRPQRQSRDRWVGTRRSVSTASSAGLPVEVACALPQPKPGLFAAGWPDPRAGDLA